jgi:two-component system OmpR family response regulator
MDATVALGPISVDAGLPAWTPANDVAQSQILVLDGDPTTFDALSSYLGGHGFGVQGAQPGQDIDAVPLAGSVDLVIVHGRGSMEASLSLCRRFHNADTPRLILVGDLDDTDCILALELGADDCLKAPYTHRELLARIRAILRHGRANLADATPGLRQFMGLTFDFRRPILAPIEGPVIGLTPGEFGLLRVFLTNPGRVLSRDELLDRARGDTEVFDRVIDVQISRLRQKLARHAAGHAIQTHRHAGYQFVARVQ